MTEKGRIVQINPVLRTNTSTGRIMQEIGALAESQGWHNWCAYGRGRDGLRECTTDTLPVGHAVSTALHGVLTRAFDRHGLGSTVATHRFVKRLKAIRPDVVHIHNIHGYFLNYPILFDYLSKSGIPVIWTVHDCWLYTGHCYYYSAIGCNRWQSGCGQCPQRGQFPRSLVIDRSTRNFRDKQRAFTSMPRNKMMIVPVSQWMRDEMSHSFLRDYPFRVIHNGIDTDVFRPMDTEAVKAKYGLGDARRIILGLASIWSREKGVDDFVAMSSMLEPGEKIVMVGVDDATARRLPDSIVTIRRTENVGELAQLYSAATAFVNPTWQDNYPTVNLEAVSCGTPVVTYRTGGSPESLTPATGKVVEQGDVAGLLAAVRLYSDEGREARRQACREVAVANFRKQDRYADYLRLYEELAGRGTVC